MFEHILVPLDRSSLAECVLPHVRAIAGAFNARVTLLTALDPLRNANPSWQSVDPFDWQVQKAEAEAYLQKIGMQLQGAGLSVAIKLLEGRAEENIIDFADRNDVSLIILSSHGQSGLSGWNVSSVVQKIILRAYTSVLIVRAYQAIAVTDQQIRSGMAYRRLLIPLDGSPRAEVVLPTATVLARYHEAEVLIAHVVARPETPRRVPLSQEDAQLVEQITERNRVEMLRYLQDLKSNLPCKIDTRLIIGGPVMATLQDLVEQSAVDLVLLSAHGYSGESNWPYGSIVVNLIAYGTAPLLIIQDMPKDRLGKTLAELMAVEHGGR
jgi:nucleotide-binding universal stress UspA family protein